MASLADTGSTNPGLGAKSGGVADASRMSSGPIEVETGFCGRTGLHQGGAREASAEFNPGNQEPACGRGNMTDKDDLGAVPDASMLSLFAGLVNFLTEESARRGWNDISANLREAGAAIASRSAQKTDSN